MSTMPARDWTNRSRGVSSTPLAEGRPADVFEHSGSKDRKAQKAYVILGLGKTGLSCARFLAAQGAAVTVVDSRTNPPERGALEKELPEVSVHVGGFDEDLIASAGVLVVSPGISTAEPVVRHARERGIPVLGDIELFARHVEAPVVAVTGSNGKSTVTALVGEMARADGRAVGVGGNLGPPALDLLTQERTDVPPDLFVLELSSFQLETTSSLHASAGTVLNVSADHMDRYPDLQSYVDAKRRVFRGAGVMVLNLDDPLVASMTRKDRRTVGFTLEKPAEGHYGLLPRAGGPWLAKGNTPLLPVAALKLRGFHNVANALAALALGGAVGLSLAGMRTALRRFTGLPHRCQLVARRDGVSWFNDSKATNVAATIVALRSFRGRGRLVLIAGGDSKGADLTPLRDAVTAPSSGIHAAVLMGRDAPRIEALLKDVLPVLKASDMVDAVAKAKTLSQPGDSVLLSPACASLDMFRDYAERGDAFVAALGGGAPDEVEEGGHAG